MALDDKKIRTALKKRLFLARIKPLSILDELGVENGRAIADVVAVYKFCHCFEIKSELDSLNRLDRQTDFYNRTFEKVTLIVTEKHLEAAIEKIPEFWGVIVVRESGGRVIFRNFRKSGVNENIDPMAILSSLWKEELAQVYSEIYQRNPPAS